jgi:mycothiol synthase
VSLPGGYRMRDVDPSLDIGAVLALLRTCDEHDADFSDATETWLREDWGASTDRGSALAVDRDGTLAAYLSLESIDPSSQVDVYMPISPAHRPALRSPWTAIAVERSQAVAADGAAIHVTVAPEEGGGPALEAHGFERVRVFWHMERSVDRAFRTRPLPPGVAIRPYRVVADDRLGWQLTTGSFADHWGLDPWPWAAWESDVIGAETWDPSLVFIAEYRREPVGIVIGLDVEGIGWVGDLGVLPHARRLGVGRALLGQAFETFASKGFTTVRLNVDSGNETGATRLYEQAGMAVQRAFDCYEKRLVAG